MLKTTATFLGSFVVLLTLWLLMFSLWWSAVKIYRRQGYGRRIAIVIGILAFIFAMAAADLCREYFLPGITSGILAWFFFRGSWKGNGNRNLKA